MEDFDYILKVANHFSPESIPVNRHGSKMTLCNLLILRNNKKVFLVGKLDGFFFVGRRVQKI